MPTILETVTLAARPEALDGLHTALDHFWSSVAAQLGKGAPLRVRFALSTAASEIAANIIRYSEADSFDVALISHEGRRLEARFEDRGLPYQGEAEAEGTPGGLAEGGFGLALARRVVDALAYDRSANGVNTWSLVVLLPGVAPP
ncbi:hypothetical protein LBMAG42_33990 [Deltaproteobacteria bacterium]|nr:hypothetical protein LBMAG42_33990 [Deltaproteobacteria bacterium]